jgi:hypothetical protein
MVFSPDPVSLGFGLANFVGGILGANSANEAAEAQAAAELLAARENWIHSNSEARRKFGYDRETLRIQKKNTEEQLAYNDRTALKSYAYQVAQNVFDYNSQVREYELRKMSALQQSAFNSMNYDFAIQDANRFFTEQMLSLDFEEKTTNLEFRYAQLGEALNFQEADIARQQQRASAQIEGQKTAVESLKAAGAAQARGGTGVSAEKAAGVAISEAALNMNSITQQVFNSEQAFGLAANRSAINLERINDTFYLDKAKIAASRVSAANQTVALRANALLNRFQADMDALASVGFGPRQAPLPPAPDRLPRPEFQKPFKPAKTPKPRALAPITTSPILAGLASASPYLAKGIQYSGTGSPAQPPG